MAICKLIRPHKAAGDRGGEGVSRFGEEAEEEGVEDEAERFCILPQRRDHLRGKIMNLD